MNKFSRVLELKNTNFANSNGLENKYNVSCSDDVAKLSFQAQKID